MKSKHEYTVNEFAKICNTTVRTINHYEELGLLQPSRVLDNGYRLFSIHQVDILSSILLYKDYGFSLKQIKDLLSCTDFNSHIKQLNLQKQMIEKQQKILLEKEKRINYTLSEFNRYSSPETFHFFCIPEQRLSITPVLNESDRYFINYLSDGFRSGVIINPNERRVTGYFSTESTGSAAISGNCICTYMVAKGFDINAALNIFKEACSTYHLPISDIYAEIIIESGQDFLFKYFMMIPDNINK